MTSPAPLAVVGNVNVDLVMGPVAPWPRPGTETVVETSEVRCGGAAGNVALTWRALGRDFQIAASTGRDAFGDWLRAELSPQSGRWPVADRATTLSVGLTHPDSERTFFTTRGHVADLSWPDVRDAIDWRRLDGGLLLLCGTFVTDRLTEDYDALLAHARDHRVRVALDTGWPDGGWMPGTVTLARRWLAGCHRLLLNEAETRALSDGREPEEAPAALLPHMAKGARVVVKCGPAGALAQAAGGPLHRVAAPRVTAADTIGAGDIFNAAYLAAEADGLPLDACLAAGVRTASCAISTSPRRYGETPLPAGRASS